jgi:dolichol-phosphate mannosyltransferase
MKRLALVVILVTVARLWLAGHSELLPEEAYYWMYAKHPAFGYFDHPPMVAWIIKAGTRLLGDTERGVRLVNTLLWVCSCVTLFRTAKIWFGERVAVWSGWLFVVLPIFVGVGFIVTPDGPLVYAWMFTLYAITRALRTGRTGFWLIAGIAFGAALLSKYYALLLAPSLLLFLLRSSKYRFWLRRWQPWAALALGLVVFSPVIHWNAHHDWASFAYQSTRTVAQKGHALVKMADFWAMQLAVLTPVGLAVFAVAAVRGIRRGWLAGDDAWSFATSFSLPLFALFVAASFKTDVHINWTAPAFLSLSMAVATAFLEGVEGKRRKLWRAGVWTIAILSISMMILGHTILATGEPKLLAYSRAGGWRELATQVEEARRALATQTGLEPFIIGADKYNIAAEMGFYLHRPDECVNLLAVGGEGMSYRHWTKLRDFDGRPAIAVLFSQKERTLTQLRSYFDHVDVPAVAPVGTHGKKWQAVALVNCYGYRSAQASP